MSPDEKDIFNRREEQASPNAVIDSHDDEKG
jgi:hypothetical protein